MFLLTHSERACTVLDESFLNIFFLIFQYCHRMVLLNDIYIRSCLIYHKCQIAGVGEYLTQIILELTEFLIDILLRCKCYRHASLSLEMLLKLVAVFGPVIRSTVSAPPAVGVDLHAEQRFYFFQNNVDIFLLDSCVGKS